MNFSVWLISTWRIHIYKGEFKGVIFTKDDCRLSNIWSIIAHMIVIKILFSISYYWSS